MPALDLPLVISLAIAAAVFLVIFAGGTAFIRRREVNARIAAAAGPRTRRQGRSRPQTVRTLLLSYANELAERINLLREQQSATIRKRLARAGFRSPDALTVYVFAKIALPTGVGVLAFVFLFGLNTYGLSLFVRIALVLAAGLAGSYLPDLLIKNWSDRRRAEIRRALPDALDLLVICTESGLSLDAGLQRVAREISLASTVLADELHITVTELRLMPDRRRPMENLAERVDLPAVQNLVNTLLQTERYGSPVSRALRTLSQEMRDERMMRAEDKASRLPATMTIPLILFILPALFVVILGPAVLDILDMFVSA